MMKIGSRTFVLSSDHFLIYHENLEDLLVIMNESNILPRKNLVIDGLYSVIAGYTSFIKHIDEVRRDPQLMQMFTSSKMVDFTNNLDSKNDHVYLIFPSLLMNNSYSTDLVNGIFKHDLYTWLLDGFNDEEVFERSEMICTLAHAIEDIFVYSVMNKSSSALNYQEVLPIYINQIQDSKGDLSLHLVVFEPLEN